MGDDPQAKNINISLGSAATGFLGTVWGKVVAILAAISLIMGIALEVQSFVTGNYILRKTAAEAGAMTSNPERELYGNRAAEQRAAAASAKAARDKETDELAAKYELRISCENGDANACATLKEYGFKP
jgi:hypothetical protein